jgi:hypothetical protein
LNGNRLAILAVRFDLSSTYIYPRLTSIDAIIFPSFSLLLNSFAVPLADECLDAIAYSTASLPESGRRSHPLPPWLISFTASP